MEMSDQLHAPATLLQKKQAPIPIKWDAVLAPGRFGHFGEQRLPPSGIEPLII